MKVRVWTLSVSNDGEMETDDFPREDDAWAALVADRSRFRILWEWIDDEAIMTAIKDAGTVPAEYRDAVTDALTEGGIDFSINVGIFDTDGYEVVE